MRKSHKQSKYGFTLVEMMLSIAIIIIISVLFVPMLISIKDSFKRVYNANDAADYAQLYAKAFENQLIYDIQNGVSGETYTYKVSPYNATNASSSCIFLANDVDVYDFATISGMNTNREGKPKWEILFDSDVEVLPGEKGFLVEYCIVMVDQFNDPGKVELEYGGSFWIPPMMVEDEDDMTFFVSGSTTGYTYKRDHDDTFYEGGVVHNTTFMYTAP
ncbi:MAG: prepilin-type N-terminal cleavage/methylation domain-containing protein [Clostridiales bacterium]|nr:prepilin-type N-terminal cleavage/methylation domain-containing protein [Clostridiales bacterium]